MSAIDKVGSCHLFRHSMAIHKLKEIHALTHPAGAEKCRVGAAEGEMSTEDELLAAPVEAEEEGASDE